MRVTRARQPQSRKCMNAESLAGLRAMMRRGRLRDSRNMVAIHPSVGHNNPL